MIEAILWDCDGVLQHSPHDWEDALARIGGGPEFATDLFEAEKQALRGERPLRDVVDDLLRERPTGATTDDVLGLWAMFVEDEDAWEVVDDVRAAGIRCVLATNQQDVRVEIMRHERGYDDRVDGAYYSSEVGHMKPSKEYFEAVLADLGVTPEQALFVDDSAANIDTARELGIAVVHHDPASGAKVLRQEIGEFVQL